ncbi:MAG: hypothetical protein IPN94_22425 [Sphingobacteriales bacterium]|nr:hypothetical protein [Sphingobacteriales bacterium]
MAEQHLRQSTARGSGLSVTNISASGDVIYTPSATDLSIRLPSPSPPTTPTEQVFCVTVSPRRQV